MYRTPKNVIMSICAIVLVTVALLAGLPVKAHASSLAGVPAGKPAVISLPAHCATTYVFLHGTQPATITCSQQKNALSAHSNVLIPNTVGSCGANDPNYLAFWADQGNIFFCGSGYTGVSPHLTHVWVIDSYVNGWDRIYPHGSTSGFYSNFWNHALLYDVFPYDRNHDITQVCLNCSPHS